MRAGGIGQQRGHILRHDEALEQAAVITGPTPLHGADVVVPDLRGGYSYVIAALAANGTSVVRNVGIIRRGYEKFFDKLTALGADFDVIG